ncbi:hypothetical protein M3J09_006221 [Ascochyta lentis]
MLEHPTTDGSTLQWALQHRYPTAPTKRRCTSLIDFAAPLHRSPLVPLPLHPSDQPLTLDSPRGSHALHSIAAPFQQCTRNQGCAVTHARVANESVQGLIFLGTLMQDELFNCRWHGCPLVPLPAKLLK